MGLKLIFLVVSRVMSLLRLSRRESWWKDAEILMLRHQLAVAERERPKARTRLTWPGPGVAGAARRDGAGREPGRDAAARHSGHYLALASQHQFPPPVGTLVAVWPLRSAGQRIARCGR